MHIRNAVYAALNNAVDNGYDMAMLTCEEISEDLRTYDADLEEYLPEDLMQSIEDWKYGKPL